MYAQFFGNYLLSHGITKEQLMHAMQEANNEHPKLGTLAMHAGYMSASEVDRVIIMQTHEDKRFGELAIREGYLKLRLRSCCRHRILISYFLVRHY